MISILAWNNGNGGYRTHGFPYLRKNFHGMCLDCSIPVTCLLQPVFHRFTCNHKSTGGQMLKCKHVNGCMLNWCIHMLNWKHAHDQLKVYTCSDGCMQMLKLNRAHAQRVNTINWKHTHAQIKACTYSTGGVNKRSFKSWYPLGALRTEDFLPHFLGWKTSTFHSFHRSYRIIKYVRTYVSEALVGRFCACRKIWNTWVLANLMFRTCFFCFARKSKKGILLKWI